MQDKIKHYLWFVSMSTGYCGTNATDVTLASTLDNYNNYLCESAYEMAVQNAESFGYDTMDCGECEGCREYGKCDDPIESDSIDYSIAIYNPAKHDSKRAGGGSFLEEYPTALLDTDTGAYYVLL